ncbi:Rtf2 RING-finger-domain-containing protein [Myxozyma melibiosi]|uniref:Rtf2 RING-finger-domain-containing protein n=1 Tax=Myxozyma melibiosi TaxID=54550 RepID=A0ABR1F386_9ASCO
MGNDGGSVPTRRELVKDSAREATSSQIFERNQLASEFAWQTCRLSLKPLELPLVSDFLGRLYNKDAVLEWLIAPETYGEGEVLVPHIKSLKDVVVLKIAKDESTGKWICPVTGKEMKAGGAKFVYHAECGHVFAESALKEIEEDECLECSTATAKENLIVINPVLDSDVEKLKARMERLSADGLTHALKSASAAKKKRKQGDGDGKSKKKESGKKKQKAENSKDVDPQRALDSVQEHSKKQRKAVEV